MDTRYYVDNVMGRELSELIADLANTDSARTEQTRVDLSSYLNRPQATLRVTAAYTLALLGSESSNQVRVELESHLRASDIARAQDPPMVDNVQDFMQGIMNQAVGLGDTEGRRRLAILGLKASRQLSPEAFDDLEIIARSSQHQQTREWAFDALNAADPGLRSRLPALALYLDDQTHGVRFKQLIEENRAMSVDFVEALKWPSSRLAAIESIQGQGVEATWAIPALVSTFESSDGAHFSQIASTLAKIDPRALLKGLESENLSVIHEIGAALAILGPSAEWAFDALDEVRHRIPHRIHSIETALREIAPDRYQSLPEFNILNEVVSLFQYSQMNADASDHDALWRLLSRYGPQLSGLPEPGVSLLVERVSAINRRLGETLSRRFEVNGIPHTGP